VIAMAVVLPAAGLCVLRILGIRYFSSLTPRIANEALPEIEAATGEPGARLLRPTSGVQFT
jgi:hypothetical protein